MRYEYREVLNVTLDELLPDVRAGWRIVTAVPAMATNPHPFGRYQLKLVSRTLRTVYSVVLLEREEGDVDG